MTQADEQALLERVVAHCHNRKWFAGQYAPEYRVTFYDADGRAHWDNDMIYAAAHAEQGFLHAPVTEEVLQDTERRLGRTLPTILRMVYTTVANGGFGPGRGLVGLPMLAKTLTVGQERLTPRAEVYLAQHPQSCVYSEQEPSDLVTLADWWSEGVYSKLDVVTGCIYRVRLGVFPPEPTWGAAITVARQAESVVDWFERWLAGTLVAYDDDEDSLSDL